MNDLEMAQLITDCTIELLKSKHFEKISIMEITKIVDISRVTFYNYFQNKEDVLDVLIENLLTNFDEIQKKNLPFLEGVDMENSTAIKDILFPNTLEIMIFFYENRKYISALVSEHSPVDFMDILYATYYNHFLIALPEIFSVKFDKVTLASYATYMTTGVKALTEEWFLSGFCQTPEKITERILTMLAPSLMELYTRNVESL
ncbi:TetR/AcrR family transcriptional regulator [Enterococcus sp. AZ192]|uniref:TetR/AcrR family transcriptional regulator n=1 Tax=unclassified Enterococcus TaxID=2608891 RepID=UPI003D286F13